MYQGLILFQFLCISLDYSFCSLAGKAHQCRCQSGDQGCKLNVSCLSTDTHTYWIGLIGLGFGFGWLENTPNFSTAGDSSFVGPMNDSCSQSLSTYILTLKNVSGNQQFNKNIPNIFDRCTSSPDYFFVDFVCVPIKSNSSEDIIIGERCQRNIPNTQSVSIYSKDFPHEPISTTFPACDCTLSTNAPVLAIQTYDNRLYVNQTLELTHKNGTVVKQWKKPGNIDEVVGNDTIPVSNSELRLMWNNNASENGGKVWIVIEVSNDAEYIKVVCDQNISSTSSSMTKALTTTTATTTTWLPNTTQGPSTPTTEIWNSSYFTQSLPTLTEMNITSNSSSSDTTHLTRSTTSASNMTHPAKPLTSGTSNSTHTTKSLTTRVSSMAHHSEVTKNPTSNGKVNLGMIIGAVCAIVLFLVILVLCLVILCKKKKQQVNPTSNQPSNSRFRQEHDARETPGYTEDNTLHNNNATSSSSIYITRLPPLPTGHVNHVSTKDGLRNFNMNESSDEEENKETSNHDGYNTVIDNIFRNRPGNTDENTYTGSVERKTAKDLVSNKHETFEMQTDGDENRDNGKKKKRKKKSWLLKKKQNMTEPLLDLTKETQDSYSLQEGEEAELSDLRVT